MATITVRALSSAGDPLFGQGQANYISDLAAVAQIIGTRLKLFQGEWWESLNQGTPMFQSILGAPRSAQAASAVIQTRILSTPYVTGLANISASLSNRALQFSCTVNTQFGSLQITSAPGASAAIPG